jgi:hypothetical protein
MLLYRTVEFEVVKTDTYPHVRFYILNLVAQLRSYVVPMPTSKKIGWRLPTCMMALTFTVFRACNLSRLTPMVL